MENCIHVENIMTMMEKLGRRYEGQQKCKIGSIIFWAILLIQLSVNIFFLMTQWDVTGFVSETADMELGARSGIVDEYMGYLYPFIVRGAVSLQGKLEIPYYIFVYCFQGVLFLVALYYLVNSLQKGIPKLLMISAICTLPMVVRCLLQVSPFLLRCVFGMLIVGSMIYISKQDGKKLYFWCLLIISYFMAAMNVPDDAYLLGMILLIFMVLYGRKKSTKQMVVMIALGICLLLCPIVVQKRNEISGGYGRMQRSIASTVFRNCMWENGEEKVTYLQTVFPTEFSMTEWPEWTGQDELQHSYGAKIDYLLGSSQADYFYKQASKALIKQYGISISADYFGWMLHQIWMTVIYNWTIILLILLSYLSNRDKQDRKLWKWIFGGMLAELLLITFTRGLLWDQRFCLLGLIMICLFCMRRDWSREEECIRKILTFLRMKLTLKVRKTLYITVVILAIVCLTGGFCYWRNLQVRRQELSGRVLCLGDSIWGLNKGADGIGAFIEAETGLLVENLAVPGTSVGRRPGQEFDGESLECIMDAVCQENKQENVSETTSGIVDQLKLETVDLVLLAYGLNDYYSGLSTKDYENGLERAIWVIREKNPQTDICIIGPTQCLFYQNGVVVADGSDRDFGGGVLDDYNRAAKLAADRNQVMFINMQEEISITRYNDAQMLADGTHLTEYGRKKYAACIIRHLLAEKES